MKPYAFDPNKSNATGCCPGHDWPRLYRYSGRYSSKKSKETDAKCNKIAKRNRRRSDKQKLKENNPSNEG